MRHLTAPSLLLTPSLLLALALAGCDSPSAPEGQVIAKVNGTEITRPELNAALPRNAGAASADAKGGATLRNAVLDQLVMQELVAQEARRQGIDKTQLYLIASRRAENQILSDLLSQRIIRNLHTPYAKNVKQYIQANPTRFERRELLRVDQIRVPAGTINEAQLRGANSLAAVQAVLDRTGTRGTRGQAVIDTISLDPRGLAELTALPPGQPFVVTENGATIVSVIVGRQPAPLTGATAERAALDFLTQQAGRDALLKQLQALRQSAKVEYQAGFSVPAGAPGLPTTKATPTPAAR